MNKCALTIIFDENYIEPALVTVCDLIRFVPDDFDVVLIYIQTIDKEVNQEALNLIKEIISRNNKINAITLLPNIFDNFKKFHFTNSILYKLVLPEIVNYDYILNIDAGYLSGPEIEHLFEYSKKTISTQKFINSAVGAICTLSENDLSEDLKVFGHNEYYPAGGILLFNVIKYKELSLYARLVSKYNAVKNILLWAEQDLLCLTATIGEIYPIEFEKTILIEQLSLRNYIEDLKLTQEKTNFMLYKITGTLKPWKYWVLDKNKLFYIKRRNEVIGNEELKKYEIINRNRYKVTHEPLYQAFLELQETKLLLSEN